MSDAPVLSAEGVEGPLDALLESARAQKIDLATLPIAALVQSFADALARALTRPGGHAPPLARWGDWLVMAATLTQLRSRLLLPADAPEAQEALNEAEALRQQLIHRAQVTAAAEWLGQQPQLGRDVFRRGRGDGFSAVRTGGDITGLLRACLAALLLPDATESYRLRPPPLWQVTDALARIGALMATLPERSPIAAFLPEISPGSGDLPCRAAVASTLIAALELARTGAVTLHQPAAWTQIEVQRLPAQAVLTGQRAPPALTVQ